MPEKSKVAILPMAP